MYCEIYQDYTTTEIMEFIESDSIVSDADVTTGRTNTRIQGENIEFVQLNEKTSNLSVCQRKEYWNF